MPVGPGGKWAIIRPSITKTPETTYALLKNVRIVNKVRETAPHDD